MKGRKKMTVKIIYDNEHEEVFDNVKHYTNANNEKKFLGMIMNDDKEIIYIRKVDIKRNEIVKEGISKQ